jgi:hypothetical protein
MAAIFFTPSLMVQNARRHILSRLKQMACLQIVLLFYYRLQGNRRHLEGKGNVIQIIAANYLLFLKQVGITIKVDFNTSTIEKKLHLRSANILINGFHNSIYIGEKCQIGGGCFWIGDNHSRIEIGNETTIAEAKIGAAEPYASVSKGYPTPLHRSRNTCQI